MNKRPSLHSEKGITLVETLAVITISSIVLVIVYQLFFSSYQSAQKIEANNELREEGDILLAFFLKELHLNQFDYINADKTVMSDSAEEEISELVLGNYAYVVNEGQDTLLKTATDDYYKITISNKTVAFLHIASDNDSEIVTVLESIQPSNHISIEKSSIETTYTTKSTIFQNRALHSIETFDGCESGIITLRFTLKHKKEQIEKEFVSKIGF